MRPVLFHTLSFFIGIGATIVGVALIVALVFLLKWLFEGADFGWLTVPGVIVVVLFFIFLFWHSGAGILKEKGIYPNNHD